MLNVNLITKETGQWIRMEVGSASVELATSVEQGSVYTDEELTPNNLLFLFYRPARKPGPVHHDNYAAFASAQPVEGQIVKVDLVVSPSSHRDITQLLAAIETLFGLRDYRVSEKLVVPPPGGIGPTQFAYGHFSIRVNQAGKVIGAFDARTTPDPAINILALRQLGFESEQIAKPISSVVGDYSANLLTVQWRRDFYFNAVVTEDFDTITNLPGVWGDFQFTAPLIVTESLRRGQRKDQVNIGALGGLFFEMLADGRWFSRDKPE